MRDAWLSRESGCITVISDIPKLAYITSDGVWGNEYMVRTNAVYVNLIILMRKSIEKPLKVYDIAAKMHRNVTFP